MAHTVTLTWDAPTDGGQVTGYNIYKQDPNGTFVKIGTSTAPTYVDSTDLTEGDTYHYQVTATGPGGESGDSNQVTATVPFQIPGVPTNLVAVVS